MSFTHGDVTGIDGDIEMVIALLQRRHGYTRDDANDELIRRLSFAVVAEEPPGGIRSPSAAR